MIDYSPHIKYTAQKIQDKVARGAYYYSMFTVHSMDSFQAKQIIEKLDKRYNLRLTSRQRNYRVNKGIPIADLIVQKSMTPNWLFIILITTQNSHDHIKNSKDKIKQAHNHNLVKDKINELENNSWEKQLEQQDLACIKRHFEDGEDFKCVLNKPYLCLSFAKYQVELIRLTHKKYASKQDKFYRQPSKTYSWTWRFNHSSMESKRKELIQIINHLISQPNNPNTLNELYKWQHYMNVYAVFRGTRQQAGRLYTFGKKFYFSRARKSWDDAQYPQLDLKIIPRYQTYAENLEEYDLRRHVYYSCGKELPREISKSLDEREAAKFIEQFL